MKKFSTLVLAIFILFTYAQVSRADGTFTYNLSSGMHHDSEVTLLQNVLIKEGYLTGTTATGNFGPLTLAAVKKYQSANSIPSTGFVGPLTRKSLNASGGTTPPPASTPVTFMPIKVSNISDTGVNLNMSYTGPGYVYTTLWFEYADSEAALDAGEGTQVGKISLIGASNSIASNIFNLMPNTTYYVRGAAQDQESQARSYGTTVTFTTAPQVVVQSISPNQPTVTTGVAGNIVSGTATLLGSYVSNGYPTSVWFEYWTLNATPVETKHEDVGSSNSSWSDVITNLALGTRYYFRIVASNSYGTSYGQIGSFLTNTTMF